MSKLKSEAKDCRDVFNSFLVAQARYRGVFELPMICSSDEVPNKLISFSRSINSRDCDQWVHFYEFDYRFERLWRDPKRYLNGLKRFRGVILPDFSVYRDMPFVMQLWNIYRSRAIGCWLQVNGIKVIANIRWGDERTYSVCCEGISRGHVIAVGSNGAIADICDRSFFIKGLAAAVGELEPKAVVVYGPAPRDIFGKYLEMGIEVVHFDSEMTCVRKGLR